MAAVVFTKGFLAGAKPGGADLVRRLESTHAALKALAQEDSPPPGLDNVAAGLVAPAVLRGRGAEVALLACCCLVDVLRLYAPEAPFTDAQKLVRGRPTLPAEPERPARSPGGPTDTSERARSPKSHGPGPAPHPPIPQSPARKFSSS